MGKHDREVRHPPPPLTPILCFTSQTNLTCSLIEINLAVIVTCMPAFKPFLRHVIPWAHKGSTKTPSSPVDEAQSPPSFIQSISKPLNPVHTTSSKESTLVYLEAGSDRNVSLASSEEDRAHDSVSSIEQTKHFRCFK